MSVHVIMKSDDGTIAEMYCNEWRDAAAYIETHRGQYTEITAKQISAEDIRQGRKGNG